MWLSDCLKGSRCCSELLLMFPCCSESLKSFGSMYSSKLTSRLVFAWTGFRLRFSPTGFVLVSLSKFPPTASALGSLSISLSARFETVTTFPKFQAALTWYGGGRLKTHEVAFAQVKTPQSLVSVCCPLVAAFTVHRTPAR